MGKKLHFVLFCPQCSLKMDNTRPWFETKTLFSALSIGPYKINQAVYNRVILYTQLAEDIATQNRLCLYVMHAIWRKILMACQKPMCYARHLGIIWISVHEASVQDSHILLLFSDSEPEAEKTSHTAGACPLRVLMETLQCWNRRWVKNYCSHHPHRRQEIDGVFIRFSQGWRTQPIHLRT